MQWGFCVFFRVMVFRDGVIKVSGQVFAFHNGFIGLMKASLRAFAS
jgi:hypothetical protein